MPINAGFEFGKASDEYNKASTTDEKIKALKNMITTAPKHKGAEKLLQQLKRRLAELKNEQIREKKAGKGGGKSAVIKREGAAQIVIIGLPNSGKSTLLSRLSGTDVEIAEYPFTTKEPVVRMVPYENIKIQAIEIPAIYAGFYNSPRGPSLLGIVRQSDLVIVLLDSANAKAELETIKNELKLGNIELGLKKERQGFVNCLPALIIMVKKNNPLEFPDETLIKNSIWKNIKKIRIQTRSKGVLAEKPVILKMSSTVEDLARLIHKDFVKNFKYAKIWGASAKFEGQQVGLAHLLKDNDIVEIYTE